MCGDGIDAFAAVLEIGASDLVLSKGDGGGGKGFSVAGRFALSCRVGTLGSNGSSGFG